MHTNNNVNCFVCIFLSVLNRHRLPARQQRQPHPRQQLVALQRRPLAHTPLLRLKLALGINARLLPDAGNKPA